MALIPDVSIVEVRTVSTYVQEVADAGVITNVEQADSIVIDSETVSLIEVGVQGPAGPAGVGSSAETHYDQRSDILSATIVYRAEASPGSPDDSPVWRIRRISISYGDTTVIRTEYAEGSEAFTFVWIDRTAYTYT